MIPVSTHLDILPLPTSTDDGNMLAIRGHIDKGLALSVFIAHLAHRRSRDLAMKVLEQGTVDHVYYGVGRAMPTGGWGFIPSMDDVQGDDTPLTILMFMSAPVAS